MKKILTILLTLVLCVAVADARKVPGDKVGVTFDSMIFDFGTVPSDTPALEHTYKMTVTGDSPVAILAATPSCGCTASDYPRKPTKPGETAEIKIVYHPGKKESGEQHKTVRLMLKNGKGKSETVTLRIIGVLVPPAK